MACNYGQRTIASNEAPDKKSFSSKTSIPSQKEEDPALSKRPKSSSSHDRSKIHKACRVRPKTADGSNVTERGKLGTTRSEIPRFPYSKYRHDQEDCASTTSRKTTIQKSADESTKGQQVQYANQVEGPWEPSKKSEYTPKGQGKKQSVIPKLKSNLKSTPQSGPRGVVSNASSKLPIKLKENSKNFSEKGDDEKQKPESVRIALRSYRAKREAKLDEKVKETMKSDFSFLVPLYESEFRRITEVWVNTLYCSLTMRTNLVKMLYQAIPDINRAQFEVEDAKLLQYIGHAKDKTKREADNLLQLVRSLLGNRDKVKEQYANGITNREIAQMYNHEWKTLSRKIQETGDETKILQLAFPELQKKKEINETNQNNKIKDMETNLEKKEAQIQRLMTQLDVLKEKESSYQKNAFLKVHDYKDVKSEVISLQSMEKEFIDVKDKYLSQNDLYEKKIKDLEFMLQEKRKVLEKEKEMKEKLQVFLNHLQSVSVDKEHVAYVMRKAFPTKDKRKEQLWSAAVRLVLRGFLIQLKKLEKDRNKMLLELQSNDWQNFSAVAVSLLKRENFTKSIKQQMNDIQKAFSYSTILTPEDEKCTEGFLNSEIVTESSG
ncbi:hypothetical protein RUM44_004684 [Polyplax serrata]|uniref:Uncharacterized protein n=1 Tax=Polyplax serrata TaxID=468196 RepID=A0ABR1B3I1_POLSC